MKKIITGFVLLLFATVSIAVAADSLTDIAKKEKERRAKLKATKTYTNKDIEDFIAKNGTNGTTDSSGGSSNPSETAGDASATPEDQASSDLHSDKNEQAWRQRFDDAQKKVDDAQKKYDDARANATSDLYTNNGVDMLTGARAKRQDAAEQAKQDLDNAQKAMDDLQEQARQNGVPPGWVRH